MRVNAKAVTPDGPGVITSITQNVWGREAYVKGRGFEGWYKVAELAEVNDDDLEVFDVAQDTGVEEHLPWEILSPSVPNPTSTLQPDGDDDLLNRVQSLHRTAVVRACPQCGGPLLESSQRSGEGWHDCPTCGWKETLPADLQTYIGTTPDDGSTTGS